MPSAAAPQAIHTAALVARANAGGGLSLVALDLPDEVAATFVAPGQYARIDGGGEKGYFVLAGEPRARWELLIRGDATDGTRAAPPGKTAELLAHAPLGTRVLVSGALGAGFPCDEAKGRTLLVLVAGTGFAAARPILARRIAEGDAGRTHVYVGLRARKEVPLHAELRTWQAAGAALTICVSRPENGAPPPDPTPSEPWRTEHSYVQDAVRRGLTSTATVDALGRAMIFTVGPSPMIDGARALAKELGIPERDVRTNY
jgi:NAD(P)H-flavin reductase